MRTKKKSPTAIYLNWLAERLKHRLEQELADSRPPDLPLALPAVSGKDPLQELISRFNWKAEEVLLLVLALAPHIDPNFFDRLILPQLPQSSEFPAIGGYRGQMHRGFLPTGTTFLFLLGEADWSAQAQWAHLFSEEHDFARQQILSIAAVPAGEPLMSGALVLQSDYQYLLSTGSIPAPRLSVHFPARRLHTDLEWEDVVLTAATREQVQEVQLWLKHRQTIMQDWKMAGRLKPGYRSLFYGPSGTGKTMTAALLGKYTGREVYLIDLSVVVSKYIGETEKNLAQLFDRAERRDWILFFDEADALFGKRSQVKDAHDRYANQEVAYLLQRIETFDGLVILASNAKSNMDEAFVRRFQSIIHFPMPLATERRQIWQKAFPKALPLAPEVDLDLLSRKYELSGAAILNIVQYCCLQAAAAKKSSLLQSDLTQGIRRELLKQNKVWQDV